MNQQFQLWHCLLFANDKRALLYGFPHVGKGFSGGIKNDFTGINPDEVLYWG
jgi:hypothetical protein